MAGKSNLVADITFMKNIKVGSTFYTDEGQLVLVTEVHENGEYSFNILESDTDFQYDSIVRDVVQPARVETVNTYGEYNYPHENIENMSGY